METLLIPLGVVGVLLLFVWITYNRLVKQKLRVKQAKSGIDVYLKQRFDLIPNLVECVKQYCKHENETFTKIAELRAAYSENKDLQVGQELNKNVNHLVAVAESYPELKANEQFLMLEKNLTKMENQLQAARRLYNIEVTSLNTSIHTFPMNLIAKAFNFQEEMLFELEDKLEAQNIKVELDD